MIDFHNHLLPAVDDGAETIEETRASLAAMRDQGVRTVVTTPHLRGSATTRAAELAATLERFDAAFAQVRELAAAEFPELRVERGVELMLDSPHLELSDPRVRLAGSRAVLVEWPAMMVPPHAAQAIYGLRVAGWRLVIAHPERYHNLDGVEAVREWRNLGAFMQVNNGSLLGRYGEGPKRLAWHLLREGLVDFLSSDYHARGRFRGTEAADALREAGGEEQLRLLTEENPARLLADDEPLPVPPLAPPAAWWRRLVPPWRR